MHCIRCHDPIQGDPSEDAIDVSVLGSPPSPIHYKCVNDPRLLPPRLFRQWAAWWMEHSQEERGELRTTVQIDMHFINRALNVVPFQPAVLDFRQGHADVVHPDFVPRTVACYCDLCGRALYWVTPQYRCPTAPFIGHALACPVRDKPVEARTAEALRVDRSRKWPPGMMTMAEYIRRPRNTTSSHADARCPSCGSQPGWRCKTRAGVVIRKSFHKTRIRASEEAREELYRQLDAQYRERRRR